MIGYDDVCVYNFYESNYLVLLDLYEFVCKNIYA